MVTSDRFCQRDCRLRGGTDFLVFPASSQSPLPTSNLLWSVIEDVKARHWFPRDCVSTGKRRKSLSLLRQRKSVRLHHASLPMVAVALSAMWLVPLLFLSLLKNVCSIKSATVYTLRTLNIIRVYHEREENTFKTIYILKLVCVAYRLVALFQVALFGYLKSVNAVYPRQLWTQLLLFLVFRHEGFISLVT